MTLVITHDGCNNFLTMVPDNEASQYTEVELELALGRTLVQNADGDLFFVDGLRSGYTEVTLQEAFALVSDTL